jgi:anti-sigma B factor antagonist
MEIGQEQIGAVQVLTPVGRLDTDSASDFELAVQDLQAAGAKHFVVDFGKVNYVSSAGLRVLLSLAKTVDGGAGSLRVCGLNPQVKQVFDVAGFTKLFQLYPERKAALDKHPEIKSGGIGKLAASLMGAKDGAGAAQGGGGSGVAKSAASLLGVKGESATPKVAATPAPAPSAAPAAPKPAPAAPAAPAKKKGFFARLFGK